MVVTALGVNDKDDVFYARPDGLHYHSRNCEMLQGNQFEKYGYVQIDFAEVKKRKLYACPACILKKRSRR